MIVRHKCIVIHDGSRRVITTFDRGDGPERGPSRTVTRKDWSDFVVPAFRKDGCRRVSHDPISGDCVWEGSVG